MSNQNIETPTLLVKELERVLDIKFKYDMAGTEANKKAPIVFTEKQDSLSIDWPTDGWCFVNPPFATLSKWIPKFWHEMNRGCKIVSLFPMSNDNNTTLMWRCAGINSITGRIWPNVRGCVVCEWDYTKKLYIRGLKWDKKRLTQLWER